MRLRTKTLTVVGATLVVLFVVLFAAAYAIVSKGFSEVEQRDAMAGAERAQAAIAGQLAGLGKTAADWAARDDAYAFMRDRNAAYANTRLSATSLASAKLDLVLFVTPEGAIAWTKAAGAWAGPGGTVPADVVQALAAETRLRSADAPQGASAVVRLPKGLMLVATRPITDTAVKKAPDGVLFVGRVLDDALVAELGRAAGLALRLAPEAEVPAPVSAAFAGGAKAYIMPTGADAMAAFAPVPGLDGEPLAVLRAEMPREVHRQQLQSLGYLLFAMLLIGVAGTLAALLVVERQVLRPLGTLMWQVNGIDGSTDTPRHVRLDRQDELGLLASAIDDMLQAIDESERQLREYRDELEVKVEERTAELGRSERRYRGLVECMADGVLTLDAEGTVTFANPRCEELTGRPGAELAGTHYRDLVTKASAQRLERYFAEDLAAPGGLTCEVELRGPDGREVPVELNASAIIGEDGEVTGVQWIARDVTERKRYEAQLQFMAEHDHLTKLLNRKRFEEELERALALARRNDKSGSVLVLDLGTLGHVSERFGQRAADDVLVSVADFLRSRMRAGNVLARLGGNAFGVLLPDADAAEADNAAERILGELKTHAVRVGDTVVPLDVKPGIVTFPADGTTSEQLVSDADAAARDATGVVASRDQLGRALAENLFLVYAQPVLDLAAKRTDRYELLIRMMDENGEVALPAAFLPVAERLGMLRDIDRHMVKAAVRLLERSGAKGPRFDVNLSAKALGDPELVALVAQELRRSGVDPARLGFEIAESVAVADVAGAGKLMSGMKDLGCRFALDDFGSGFSSFYYLKHLPIDCLKIDGGFIRDLAQSASQRHLVAAISEMCRALGVACAAEFVEDAETLEKLPELGVTFAQGYVIGRPKPVEPLLEQWPSAAEESKPA